MTMHAPQPARLILSAPVTPRFTLSKGTGPSPGSRRCRPVCVERPASQCGTGTRSEEHTSELQSQSNLVCRLLLEKKKKYMYSLAITESKLFVFDVLMYNVPDDSYEFISSVVTDHSALIHGVLFVSIQLQRISSCL